MARRFGRNQRRKLLAELSATQHALGQAVHGFARPASLDYQHLASFGHVLEYDVRDVSDRRRKDKTADVTIYVTDVFRLTDLVNSYPVVTWRGTVWRIVETRVPSEYEMPFHNDLRVELRLAAEGSRAFHLEDVEPLTAAGWARVKGDFR